jgi:hypothetical protein
MSASRAARLSDPSFEPTGRQFDVIARKAQGVVAARKAHADKQFSEHLRAQVRATLRGMPSAQAQS